MEIFRRNIKELDFTLIGTMVLLAAFGCLALLATTYGKSTSPNGSVPPHVLSKQIVFEIIGFVMMLATAAFDYRILRKYRWWIYGVVIVLLLAVFGFHSANRGGAHSWIPLGPLTFEPSEFMKLAMIIVIAGFMADNDESDFPDYRLHKTWPIWLVFIVPFALIYKQPALGQALVMFAIVMTMMAVYVKRFHFFVLTLLLVVLVGGLTLIATQYSVQTVNFLQNVVVGHHIIKEFQLMRILTWLDPKMALSSAGYSVHETQMAIGSGQIFGEGLFNGIETGGGWIPNQWTDYIFSGVGEEFGFLGSSVLVLLFLIVFYRMTRIAGTARDTFGTYLIIGLVGMFGFQVFENIGMDMYMSPATGITLPFVTYGGSSLILNYIAIGLSLSVCLRRKRLRFS